MTNLDFNHRSTAEHAKRAIGHDQLKRLQAARDACKPWDSIESYALDVAIYVHIGSEKLTKYAIDKLNERLAR